VIHAQRQNFGVYLCRSRSARKNSDCSDGKKYGFVVTEQRNSTFVTMVNRSRFGMGPNRVLSVESDCAPPENMRLQFDCGQIVVCESALFESGIMRQQERRTGLYSVDQ